MSGRPAVLIMQRHLARVSPFLESQWTVHHFWEGPPVEAEHEIQAVVVNGRSELDKALIEKLPNLKLIACFGAGYDGIDVAWCNARGISVSHAPGINNDDVADHALGLILAARRRIVEGDRTLRVGEWTPEARIFTPAIRGQKLGIVGLGAIGQSVATRAEAFGMAVSWWGPRDKPSEWPRTASLLELAEASDVLVVACRADETNVGLISREIIEAVGSQGLLVNIARGQLIDEDALIAALKDGRLGQAALDVFADEPTDPARWADVPNTVLTPHTGGATNEAVQAMLMLLMQNVSAAFEGRPLVTEAKP